MKKQILITTLILLSVSLPALELYTFGSMSYDFDKAGIDYLDDNEWFETSLAAGISQDVWKFTLYAEAEQITEMYKSGVVSFKPTHQDYYVRGGLWIGFLFAEYEHLCMHNVDSVNWERNGGYNRVTVGFDSRRGK